MAVDSRSKRASVLGVGLAAAITPPLADGTVNALDQHHMAFAYRLQADEPAAPPPFSAYSLLYMAQDEEWMYWAG
jgi:hypothetical protein